MFLLSSKSSHISNTQWSYNSKSGSFSLFMEGIEEEYILIFLWLYLSKILPFSVFKIWIKLNKDDVLKE